MAVRVLTSAPFLLRLLFYLGETKTKDNVFVQVAVAVQYRVLAESAYEAYYR